MYYRLLHGHGKEIIKAGGGGGGVFNGILQKGSNCLISSIKLHRKSIQCPSKKGWSPSHFLRPYISHALICILLYM